MTMDEILKETSREKTYSLQKNKKQFLADLEEFLKKYSLVERFWLSADKELLTIDFFGGTRKAVNIGRDSNRQIILDLISAGVI